MPVDAKSARLFRRAVGGAVALALGLTCVVLSLAASPSPASGMSGIAGIEGMAGMAGMVGAAATVEPEGPVDTATAPAMSGTCGTVCVTDVSQLCTIAGLTLTTLLALLLATRRDTFLGLLARRRSRGPRCRRRHQTPWTVLSPISLGLLRV